MRLSPAMLALLRDLVAWNRPSPYERYRGPWGTAKALKSRGLATVQWVGMGFWRAAPTLAGRELIEELDRGA